MDDDLLFLCGSALLLSLLAIAFLELLKKKPSSPRLPPGPRNLPVIGSAHRLVNTLAHRALRDMAEEHGPLMHLRVGQVPVVVVSSKELARDVLKTHDANFATRPKLVAGGIVAYDWTDILFSPSGDYWRKLRRLCIQEILSTKRILSFQHIREDEVLNLVDEIRAAGPSTPVDLSSRLHRITNSIVSRAAFGRRRSNGNAADFLAAIKQSVVMSSGFYVPDLFPSFTGILSVLTGMRRKLRGIRQTVDGILEEIICEREEILKQARTDDDLQGRIGKQEDNLVDVLLGLQENGDFGFPMTRNTIKAIILDMFAGGTGTSASAMEWAMSELMANPKVMRKLQAEIRAAFPKKQIITETDLRASDLKYLKFVMKETLRLHPPAPLLVPRESIEACEISGYMIPAKARVIVNSWAISRDPKYWEDAEEFKPERFQEVALDFFGSNYEYTPFGSGRRMCPGYNYGLASMELTLAQLLHSFDWSLPDGMDQVDMSEAPGLGVRRKTPLLMCATPYAFAS
ncbi:Premnaspirodiene oxygenase [Dichanthelium oligosanthes]|uniref:Premnaspirodiene oxygenase n=1 Tax=Dichanthelium oligosanthes TaxID=888268 RepID=A0A1E5VKJ8_9POAL|nr:Premnaspirodiene oxygenase [Dichanthelium oligosanthes]